MTIWTPEEAKMNSLRRPYCACCGLPYTHTKFGGKVMVANPPGKHGKQEIMFCEKCAHTDEAQDVYKEIMSIVKSDLIILPDEYPNV